MGQHTQRFLIESDYTIHAKVIVLPPCSFSYNPSTLIYDQGMAHPSQLITVPYHFSL